MSVFFKKSNYILFRLIQFVLLFQNQKQGALNYEA